nr:hypothetical protein [Crucivirus sp.]
MRKNAHPTPLKKRKVDAAFKAPAKATEVVDCTDASQQQDDSLLLSFTDPIKPNGSQTDVPALSKICKDKLSKMDKDSDSEDSQDPMASDQESSNDDDLEHEEKMHAFSVASRQWLDDYGKALFNVGLMTFLRAEEKKSDTKTKAKQRYGFGK